MIQKQRWCNILKKNNFLGDFIKISSIFILVMLAAFALNAIEIRTENIFLIFLLGIAIGVVETKSFYSGIILSVIFVLAFNFFFTEPIYTLKMYDANYYISFGLFIIVAFICSSLTRRLQKQIEISEYNKELSTKLYKIAHGFLNLSGFKEICIYAEKSLGEILNKKSKIVLKNFENISEEEKGYFQMIAQGFYDKNIMTSEKKKIYPLKSKEQFFGIIVIDCSDGDIETKENLLVDTIISQTVITLQREFLNLANEEKNINIEREKLKTSLLRGISHDLRTPLTGIAGGAGFLSLNYSDIDKETACSILKDIENDAIWLSEMVENLLNMTKIQDGKLTITKKNEVVDDIISEAVSKVIKRKEEHKVVINKTKDIILVPMEGRLIIQVLVNLLDNAFKHSKPKSTITLSVEENKNNVSFKISDNDGGIKEEDIDKIFDNFYSANKEISDKKRGIGLGLSICKAVVNAHGGEIKAFNNDEGGATFVFTLPKEKKNV